MQTKDTTLCAAVLVWAGLMGASYAADSVIVASIAVPQGVQESEVRIRLVNADTARAVVIPLEIRPVSGGCMPTSVTMRFEDRLLTGLDEIQVTGQYAVKDGICGPTGEPSYWTAHSETTAAPVQVIAPAWGVLFGAFGYPSTQYMRAGSDSVGSFVLTFGLPDLVGAFEIDTVCIGPNNHLLYLDEHSYPFVGYTPVFVSGLIEIVECVCMYHGDIDGSGSIDATDLAILIDYVFFGIGQPASDPSCPHVDRGDFNCDGADDATDVAEMIDHVNFGGPPPCDPCRCDPYPTSCP